MKQPSSWLEELYRELSLFKINEGEAAFMISSGTLISLMASCHLNCLMIPAIA
jgi:hypothetical protein